MESDALKNVPEVSFIDDTTIQELQEQMIKDFQEKYEEITGTGIELAKADPYRLILYACSLQQYQGMVYIDTMGKMNLLKYSIGAFLDQIALLRGVRRLQGSKAITTIKFGIEEARISATSIPKGTRLSAGSTFFATTEYAEIPIGDTSIEVPAECVDLGTIGNGFMIGEVSTLVDSVPFISAASNTTETANGTEIEDDDTFVERIFLSPSQYSVAGPEDAYKYLVKNYNSNIADVNVTSPSEVAVDIRFILEGGVLPGSDLITEVTNYISGKTKRPLTDYVTVAAPEVLPYAINVKYWINDSDKSVANSIQSQVETAIDDYKRWQDSVIGRDINPSELIYMIKNAGAKRVEVTAPVFTVVADSKIPQNSTKTVVYGGIEND